MARLLLFIVLFIVFEFANAVEAAADVRVPGTSAEVKLQVLSSPQFKFRENRPKIDQDTPFLVKVVEFLAKMTTTTDPQRREQATVPPE